LALIAEVEKKDIQLKAVNEKLRDFYVEGIKEASSEAKTASEESTMFSLLTIGLGMLSGVFLAVFFSRSLVNTLSKISDSIAEASEQVSSAANQIASSSETLSQATTEQSASLEETASAIEEMSSMVSKNSENSKSAASVSTQAQGTADNGKHAVEQMVGAMDEISESNAVIMNQIEYSNNQISEIVKVIEEIGSKTKVINDIVFQTKLLSFNASVEAARAGEHGKGFAVVAEEVGNLAQMSGNAAQEISSLLNASIQKVEGIVQETKTKVSDLIAQGKLKIETGSNVAKQCGDILNEIVTNVTNVSAMAGEISAASEEQSRGVQEITKAMGQLNQVTQSNAATSEESARSAEELSAQAEALKNLVGDLVVTVQGKTDASVEPSRMVKPKPAKKPEGKVVAIKKDFLKKPSPLSMKKASGDDSATPAYDDARFKEV
jgi:methyl-accepting chemotaxis protein